MLYRNICFHNVVEMTPEGDGMRMWRVPEGVRSACSNFLRETTAAFSNGVELRFRMKQDRVRLTMRTLPDEEVQVAHIYYGSIQGGCRDSARIIGTENTVLEINRPGNMEDLKSVTKEAGLAFSPEVVRVVLPYGVCVFVDIEGEVEPPREGDTPKETYLAYGSSITHGSMALASPYTYPFRVAQRMNCDYINLGFAGTAQLEREMAEYIVGRKDWTFASLEMGINMLGFSEEAFERRVDEFTSILAADGRPVFATSIFAFRGNGEQLEKADRFREIVGRYAGERLIFADGLDIMGNPAFATQDMVHPSLEGMERIAWRWGEIMQRELKDRR